MDNQTLAAPIPVAAELPTLVVNRKTYYVDSRLRELRNVADPHDRIVFGR